MATTMRQPGGDPVTGQPGDFEPIKLAKALLRETGTGSLATSDAETGHPFCSLTSVATAEDGAPVMLVSRLSAHTINLLADPRVSLLLARAGKGDALAHPRLTITGRAVPEPSPPARTRFLARHPKAELYSDFPDFLMVRLEPEGAHLNGGFARAARLSSEELLTDLAGAEGLLARAEAAIAHMNADHAEAISDYATGLLGLPAGPWRLIGVDPEGCDLLHSERAARLAFPQRVTSGEQLRAVLVDLARGARPS